MGKIRVLHQVLDPSGSGGVSAEFRALKQSMLTEKYDFEPMILIDFRPGLNLHDIKFYVKKIREYQPDIIHVRGAAIDGLNAVLAAKICNTGKILVTVHGMYSDLIFINLVKKWISKQLVERLIFGLADGISCVCETAEKRDYFNRYRKKMLPLVYNRMPQFNPSLKEKYRKEIRNEHHIAQDALVGLYVGRITREKGLDTLFRAVQLMKDQLPKNLIFLFVGDGEFREQLQLRMSSIGVNAIFTGNQNNIERFYYSGDFFIQPSLHENHSIALLEACAAQIPCITTDCGGNTEIIDNEIGIIIPVDSEYMLSKAILEMCDKNRRDYYYNNLIKKDFNKFSNQEVDKALDSVYRLILNR